MPIRGGHRPGSLVLVGLLGLALAGLPGCGGGEGTGQSEAVDEDVAEVFAALGAAGRARDGRRVCDELLARAVVRSIEATGSACEVAVRDALRRAASTEVVPTSVVVGRRRAVARVRSVERGRTVVSRVVLVRERGGWRLSRLGPASP